MPVHPETLLWMRTVPMRFGSEAYVGDRDRLLDDLHLLQARGRLDVGDWERWVRELSSARSAFDVASGVHARRELFAELNRSEVPEHLGRLMAAELPERPREYGNELPPVPWRFLTPAAAHALDDAVRRLGGELGHDVALDVAFVTVLNRRWELQRRASHERVDQVAWEAAARDWSVLLPSRHKGTWGIFRKGEEHAHLRPSLHHGFGWYWATAQKLAFPELSSSDLLRLFGRASAFAAIDPYARVLATTHLLPLRDADALLAAAAMTEFVAALRAETTGREPGWQALELASRVQIFGEPEFETLVSRTAARAEQHWFWCRVAAEYPEAVDSDVFRQVWHHVNSNTSELPGLQVWLQTDDTFLAAQPEHSRAEWYATARCLVSSGAPHADLPLARQLARRFAPFVEPQLRQRIDDAVESAASAAGRMSWRACQKKLDRHQADHYTTGQPYYGRYSENLRPPSAEMETARALARAAVRHDASRAGRQDIAAQVTDGLALIGLFATPPPVAMRSDVVSRRTPGEAAREAARGAAGRP